MTLQTLIVILSIIFIHWVADFIFQDEEWAVNKSKSFNRITKTILSSHGIKTTK